MRSLNSSTTGCSFLGFLSTWSMTPPSQSWWARWSWGSHSPVLWNNQFDVTRKVDITEHLPVDVVLFRDILFLLHCEDSVMIEWETRLVELEELWKYERMSRRDLYLCNRHFCVEVWYWSWAANQKCFDSWNLEQCLRHKCQFAVIPDFNTTTTFIRDKAVARKCKGTRMPHGYC